MHEYVFRDSYASDDWWLCWWRAVCVTHIIHMCEMSHSCDIYIYIYIHIYIYTWIRIPRRICVWCLTALLMTRCMCDTCHSYMWHDSFIRVTWVIHMIYIYIYTYIHVYMYTCATTHMHLAIDDFTDDAVYVWHTSFIRVTRGIHMICKYTCIHHLRYT